MAVLRDAGVPRGRDRRGQAFADHHAFSRADLDALVRQAGELDATPIATAKDAIELAAADLDRVAWLAVELEPPAGALADLLRHLLETGR